MSRTLTPWVDFVYETENKPLGEWNKRRRIKHMAKLSDLLAKRIKDRRLLLRSEHPWLREYDTIQNWRFTETDEAFARNPKRIVSTLLLYADAWLGERIQRQLIKELRPYVKRDRQHSRSRKTTSSKCLKYWKKAENKRDRDRAMEQVYKKLFKRTKNGVPPVWLSKGSTSWSTFPKRIITFCCRHCKSLEQEPNISNISSERIGSRLRRYFRDFEIVPGRSPLLHLQRLEDEAQSLALRIEGEEARDREANPQVETDRPQLEAVALSMERETREAADKTLREQVESLRRETENREAQLGARIDAFDKALASPCEEAKNEEARSNDKIEGLERDVQFLRDRLEQLSLSAEAQGQEMNRLRKGKDKAIGDGQEQDVEIRGTDAKKMKQQQFAIMHLSYRHIMEGLPPPKAPVPKTAPKTANSKSKRSKPQQGTGHKQAWTDLWSSAYKEAKDGKAGPVKELLDGLPGSISHNQILEDGKNLYGIYSANIHGFGGYHGRDVYDVEEGTISNLTERVILEALKPLDDNVGDDGMVDWAAERARFI